MNRTALVTGASSGIGAATARSLAAAGAQVTLVARRRDRIEAIANEIGAAFVAADVADRAALDAIAGDFDLVVANAGVMLPSPAEEADADDLERMLDANLIGLVNTVRAFGGQLLSAAGAGRPSDLIVVSSIAARITFPAYATYAATKAGATQFTRGVRAEWAARGVRVTTIEPGLTRTELRDHVRPGLQEELDGMFEQIGSLRPEDVADVIAYVAGLPQHVNLSQIELVPSTQA
jgi:NADP-dependent 3-hydroxy acid dehydrogenase YdfG